MSSQVEKMAELAGTIAAFNKLTRAHNPFDGEIDNHLWDCWDGGFMGAQRKVKPPSSVAPPPGYGNTFKGGVISGVEHTHAYLDLSKKGNRLKIVKQFDERKSDEN